MRAVRVTALGGPDSLTLAEVADPEPSYFATPGSGVVIDVRAAGVAFPDVLMTRGEYQLRPELPFTPGIEVAGVVAAASPDARVLVGERVAAFMDYGGLAERAVAPTAATFPLPDELDFAEGAGLVVNYHTAYFALVNRGRLTRGETVIVHGAAGGLGSAAVQVARALGARTIAVVSDGAKAELAMRAGAAAVVLTDEPWHEAASAIVGERGVDIVFDPVGGERVVPSLRLLREDGRLLVVGFTSGTIPEVKVNRLLLGNTAVIGAGWGAYIASRPDAAPPIGQAVNELVRSGRVRPVVGARFKLEEAAEAMRSIESRQALGKVVVEIG